MTVIDEAQAKIKGRKLKLVLPEGGDERIGAAAHRLREQDLADPIIFGDDVAPAGPAG